MKISKILEEIEKLEKTDFNKAVTAYAYDIVEDLSEDLDDLSSEDLESTLLNGAPDWSSYSHGCSSLIYDSDILDRFKPQPVYVCFRHNQIMVKYNDLLDEQAKYLKLAAQLVAAIVQKYSK